MLHNLHSRNGKYHLSTLFLPKETFREENCDFLFSEQYCWTLTGWKQLFELTHRHEVFQKEVILKSSVSATLLLKTASLSP